MSSPKDGDEYCALGEPGSATAELDGTDNLTTLPHPMNFLIRAVLCFVVAALVLPEPGVASVIFQPGKKASHVAPGDEEISGNAAELFQIGQTAEKEGDMKRAIKAYKSLVKRHPKDALAAGALYRAAELQEQTHRLSCPPRIRFANSSKDIPPARTLMKQSRRSFASAKSI